jgi:hypothetical protein
MSEARKRRHDEGNLHLTLSLDVFFRARSV